MISLQDALLVKEQYSNLRILYFKFKNLDFLFRPITPREYTQAKVLTQTKEEFNDLVCQICLLSPSSDDYDFNDCGYGCIADNIAEEIIAFSLIEDSIKLFDFFEYSRENTTKFISQCCLFIKAAFPEHSMEEIEGWDYYKIMDMTAKAEFILKIKGIEYKLEYNLDDLGATPEPLTENELLRNGIDPMFYNNYNTSKEFIEYPVILGSDWRNEGKIRDVREQILKGRYARKGL